MSSNNWMIVIDRPLNDALVESIAACGLCVMLAPDIYDLPADSHLGSAINEYDGDVLVCTTMTERAAKWVLNHIGVEKETAILNTEQMDNEKILEAICDVTDAQTGAEKAVVRDFSQKSSPRWYPVIDFDRCTNCHSCVEFCLFGVYELDAKGDVFVAIADNCKAGCPSCARVCPTSAIMFPRYPAGGPIAGGEGTIEQLAPQEARKAGGEDVKLFRESGGQTDDGEEINSTLDDLENFDL